MLCLPELLPHSHKNGRIDLDLKKIPLYLSRFFKLQNLTLWFFFLNRLQFLPPRNRVQELKINILSYRLQSH